MPKVPELVREEEDLRQGFSELKVPAPNHFIPAKDWMLVSTVNIPAPSPSSYIEILTPTLMVLEGIDFGRCLGCEGGVFVNGISVHIKEAPES